MKFIRDAIHATNSGFGHTNLSIRIAFISEIYGFAHIIHKGFLFQRPPLLVSPTRENKCMITFVVSIDLGLT